MTEEQVEIYRNLEAEEDESIDDNDYYIVRKSKAKEEESNYKFDEFIRIEGGKVVKTENQAAKQFDNRTIAFSRTTKNWYLLLFMIYFIEVIFIFVHNLSYLWNKSFNTPVLTWTILIRNLKFTSISNFIIFNAQEHSRGMNWFDFPYSCSWRNW